MAVTYIVQMNMADRGQETQWTDCEDAKFATRAQALTHIEWMKKEYGDTIQYRAQPYAEYPSTPAYYEADGGSMWNGVGRSYTGW
jgi:hypothetical protein